MVKHKYSIENLLTFDDYIFESNSIYKLDSDTKSKLLVLDEKYHKLIEKFRKKYSAQTVENIREEFNKFMAAKENGQKYFPKLEIKNSDFDNSIYDCFEKAITKEYDWIKKENSNYFKLSTRKITILRLKELFKEEKFDEIDKLLEGGIKKLEISYIKVANMFLENGKKEKAIEFALKENNDSLLEEKINLLIKLEKYEDAAEAALKIKDEEKCLEKFNNIGSKLGNDPARREGIQKIFDRRK